MEQGGDRKHHLESGAKRIHGQAAPGISLVLLSQERVGKAQSRGPQQHSHALSASHGQSYGCFPRLFLRQDSLDPGSPCELLAVRHGPGLSCQSQSSAMTTRAALEKGISGAGGAPAVLDDVKRPKFCKMLPPAQGQGR